MKLITIAALASFAISGRAFADSKSEAKEHVARATELHHDGKFAEALDELKTAYTLDPQPDLLYAIAQVHVKLGECTQAITFYERFLASDPKPGPAAAAHEAIETCKTNPPVIDTKPPIPPVPVDQPKPPVAKVAPPPPIAIEQQQQPSSWYSDKLADGLVIGGVVGGVVALVLYENARSNLSDAQVATSYPKQQALVDSANTNRMLAVIFGVGGAGLALTGVIHYILSQPDDHGVGIAPTHGGSVVTWTTRF